MFYSYTCNFSFIIAIKHAQYWTNIVKKVNYKNKTTQIRHANVFGHCPP